LEAEAGVVAEGGNLNAGFAACVNEQRAAGGGELLSVDCEVYVGHYPLLFDCKSYAVISSRTAGVVGISISSDSTMK
jgi:hypothetical protein